MHCPSCGEEIESGLESCPQCGEDLGQEEKPYFRRVPRLLHPLAVMGYIILLSGLMIFLQLRFRGARPPASSESETAVPSQPAVPAREEITLQTVNESDKKWMEVCNYEQPLKPIFAGLAQLDSQLSQPGLKLDGMQVQAMIQKVNDLLPKADSLEAPTGLGPCSAAVKNSVELMKSAVNSFWNFQSTGSKDSEVLFNQSLANSRSQKDYCAAIIANLKKDLEKAGLSKSKAALEKAAPDFFSQFTPPPAPQPTPAPLPLPGGSSASPQPAPPPAPEPASPPSPRHERPLRAHPKPGQQPHPPSPEQPPAEAPAEGGTGNPELEPGSSVAPEPGGSVQPGDSQ